MTDTREMHFDPYFRKKVGKYEPLIVSLKRGQSTTLKVNLGMARLLAEQFGRTWGRTYWVSDGPDLSYRITRIG